MKAREIHDLTGLRALLAEGVPLTGVRLQGLDLTGELGAELARRDCRGLVVLGGQLAPGLQEHLIGTGATVFPTGPQAPVDPYRSLLYRPQELYSGLLEDGYQATPDARAYAWTRQASADSDVFVALLRAIHDQSMSDALDELLEGRRVVAVMGGHALLRDSTEYADAARLGHRLAAGGASVMTGGGPGAMEAANLGAFCSGEATLEEALREVAKVPSFRPSIDDWAISAWQSREQISASDAAGAPSDAGRSIGVPTWFYGHEPPNLFAGAVAKFFSNALREDQLVGRCRGGVVVLPGAAGTVQEVFQAITPLYYAESDKADQTQPLPPLVLVGRRHWSQNLPVWDAVQALAAGRRMQGCTHLVDSVAEAADLLSPGAA